MKETMMVKLVRHGLILAAITGLVVIGFVSFLVSPPRYVEAALSPVDLGPGGEGASSCNIANIKPGDCDTKIVELHNEGKRDGVVAIWISNIQATDYRDDGGALGNYLLFNLSSQQLETNVCLPAKISDLPQSASDDRYIKIRQINGGETIALSWQWEFWESGQPQNEAQGDRLSFSINYMLTELPPPGVEHINLIVGGSILLIVVGTPFILLLVRRRKKDSGERERI